MWAANSLITVRRRPIPVRRPLDRPQPHDAWSRLETRLDGLTDAEWRWRPSPFDPEISIQWRTQHLAGMLTEPRSSFVLHVADELIHHGAQAALLRDLYSSPGPARLPVRSPTPTGHRAPVDDGRALARESARLRDIYRSRPTRGRAPVSSYLAQ